MEEFRMEKIKIKGWACELYRLFYIAINDEEPPRNESLFVYLSLIANSVLVFVTTMILLYPISIWILDERSKYKNRNEMISELSETFGKPIFYCWLVLNTIALGYCLFNYTIITIAIISVIIAIAFCSKLKIELVCANKA